jgi:hypothetical protein
MLIKKYKTLKFISALVKLNNIIRNSCFFCLIQAKHLTDNEWINFKKLAISFNLNIYICKNSFLKSKVFPFNLTANMLNSLNQGNLTILYSINNLSSSLTNHFFIEDFLLRKIKMSPLIFYSFNRFFHPEKYFKLLKLAKQEYFYKIIVMLKYSSCTILNEMISTSKFFLLKLNRK